MAKKQSMKYLEAMTSTDSKTTDWEREKNTSKKVLPPEETP